MSTVHLHRQWSWLMQSLITAAIIFVLTSFAFAQTTTQAKPPPSAPDDPLQSKKSESDTRFGSPENEMRSKAAIKEDKKKYDENLARAREVSDLASQLNKNFLATRGFNADDAKRLERLEKLTKRIRNDAGGSESEPDPDMKDICAKIEDTVKHLADLADELNKMVEKTPRNVISAAVIDQANRLVLIAQHLRSSR